MFALFWINVCAKIGKSFREYIIPQCVYLFMWNYIKNSSSKMSRKYLATHSPTQVCNEKVWNDETHEI